MVRVGAARAEPKEEVAGALEGVAKVVAASIRRPVQVARAAALEVAMVEMMAAAASMVEVMAATMAEAMVVEMGKAMRVDTAGVAETADAMAELMVEVMVEVMVEAARGGKAGTRVAVAV